MFGRLLGEVLSLPLKVVQVPTKIIKAVDEATIDSGVGEAVDDIADETVGRAGRAIQRGCEELDR